MALSSEGTTALIGGPDDNEGVGAAWVFTRTGTTWTQQGAKLTGSGERRRELGEGEFGYSVALSAEGNTALIGGPGDNGSVGAAWVFTRSGTTWTQQGAKLTGSRRDSAQANSAQRGALRRRRTTTALIGGHGDNDGVGAAWVFTRAGKRPGPSRARSSPAAGRPAQANSATAWRSPPKATPRWSAAPRDNGDVGAAWVFTRTGTTWTQQGAKLIAKTGEETGAGEFGTSVALAAKEGNTALIGGPGDKEGIGAAWVFTRTGTTWTQQGAKLVAKSGEETGEGVFGDSVALSAEGDTALIGGPGDKEGTGAAWVFTRSGTTWTQQGAKLVAKSGEETGAGEFGASVALSAKEGNTALIGAPGDNSGSRRGVGLHALEHDLDPAGREAHRKRRRAGAGQFGQSVALSSEGNTALMGGPDDTKDIGAAWVFTRSGTTWTQQGEKLTGAKRSAENRRQRRIRLQRGALLRRQHRADRRPGDNARRRRGMGVHALGHDMDPAGRSSRGSGDEAARANSARASRSPANGNTALIGGSVRQPEHRRGVGVHAPGSTWTQQGES